METILIVDDNEKNLYSFNELLKDSSRKIICVNSGTAALEILIKEECSLILMDVQMPQMNGFDTAKMIKIPTWLLLGLVGHIYFESIEIVEL